MKDPAIRTENLTKRYGNIIALDNLNIDVRRGEVFGLLGPNGAGKTTAIELLATLVKPTAGNAWVGGHSILTDSGSVRRSIGIVYQDPSSDDILTARENLYLHALMYGIPRSERKKRIEDVLSLVDLSDRADDLVRTFSGGMRRRLELARGLSHQPSILFLDEPTLGLDPQTREHIWKYIEKLVKEDEHTIILTTHYMEEADRLCDRIAIIDNGKILVNDTPESLKGKMEGDLVMLEGDQLKRQPFEALDYARVVSYEEGSDDPITSGTKRARTPKLELVVKETEKHLPEILDIAGSITSVQIRKPSLNDVFLHYTGRQMRAESAENIIQKQMIVRRQR